MELPTVDWLDEARQVGEYLLACTRRAVDGSLVWLKPPRPDRGKTAPQALGPHLYAGCTGVALFLAALGHVLRERRWTEISLRSLAPVRRRLAALVASPPQSGELGLKIGGTIGLGSLIYAFVRAGRWLEEPTLVDEARGTATLITPERIAADESLDLMFGSAGAILGLLVLDREGSPSTLEALSPLDRAVLCGEQLLRRRDSTAGEPRAWPFKRGTPLCGFAHGASGICYALALLAQRTGREDFLQAALEGLAFERLHYSPEEENWRASLEPGKPFMMAWCNGAPGIALGRIQLWDLLKRDDVESELEAAVDITRNARESGFDFVCCGNMGRAEILLQAAGRTGREDLSDSARKLAAQVALRGALRQHPPDHPHYNPGFFRGAAGIGYSLLRCSDPSLPCVLALE